MYDSRIEYSPRRTALYVPYGSVLTICASTSPASAGEDGLREQLPRRAVPAQPEVLRDVCDSRPLDAHGGVVPADAAPRDMRRRIPGISAVERQVDAADERDPVVDHDRLLVVGVRESRAAVGVRLDLRMPRRARRASRERPRATA